MRNTKRERAFLDCGKIDGMNDMQTAKMKEFQDIVDEFLTSYDEYVENHDGNASQEALKQDWIKREIGQRLSNVNDTFFEDMFSGLEQVEQCEEYVKEASMFGQDATAWLYNALRPDCDRGDDTPVALTEMQGLYELYAQMIHTRHMMSVALPTLNCLKQWKQDDGNEPNAAKITSKKDINETLVPGYNNMGFRKNVKVNPSVTDSFQKLMISQYQKGMHLDIGYDMSRMEMSMCAMDDLAYHLSKNAVLMGTGSMALAATLCLGTSYLEGKRWTAQREHLMGTTLRLGAKSGMRIAVMGALKVGAARNMLPIMAGAASTNALLAIATIGVECGDAMIQYANGSIDALQAVDRAGRSSTAGIFAMGFGAQGAILGATALAALPLIPLASPIIGSTAAFPVVGELIGGGAGIFVGSIVGRKAYEHTRGLAVLAHQISKQGIKCEELWEKSSNMMKSGMRVVGAKTQNIFSKLVSSG